MAVALLQPTLPGSVSTWEGSKDMVCWHPPATSPQLGHVDSQATLCRTALWFLTGGKVNQNGHFCRRGIKVRDCLEMDLCRNQLEILNFLMLSLNKTCPNFLNFSPKLKSRHFCRNKSSKRARTLKLCRSPVSTECGGPFDPFNIFFTTSNRSHN